MFPHNSVQNVIRRTFADYEGNTEVELANSSSCVNSRSSVMVSNDGGNIDSGSSVDFANNDTSVKLYSDDSVVSVFLILTLIIPEHFSIIRTFLYRLQCLPAIQSMSDQSTKFRISELAVMPW